MRRPPADTDLSTEIDLSEGRSTRSIAITVSVVAAVLIGLYLWLSHGHSASLRLARVDGELQVQKGLYAPWGWGAHTPSTALAPLTIEADIPVREGPCADLADCEARFFEVILEQARRALRQPERRAEAMALLHRASRLAPESAQSALRSLQDEGQYHKGLLALDTARATLIEARRHFFAVRGAEPETVEQSAQWMRIIDDLIDSLDAARTAAERNRRPSAAPKDRDPMPPRRPAGPPPSATAPPPAVKSPAPDAGLDLSGVEAGFEGPL